MNDSKSDNDVLGEAIRAVRAMIERHYPEAEYAAVVVHVKDGVPDIILPVATTPPKKK